MLASAVLAFVVAALTQAIVAGQMQTYASIHDTRALALAESLLDEVVARDYPSDTSSMGYTYGTGETAANVDRRTAFTSIGDYHNFTQSANGLSDIKGTLLPTSFQTYSRTVTVVETTLTISGLGGDLTGLKVTVTVSDPGTRTWTLTRWVREGGG